MAESTVITLYPPGADRIRVVASNWGISKESALLQFRDADSGIEVFTNMPFTVQNVDEGKPIPF